MGRDLFEGCDAARGVFKRADEVLGFSLSQLCFEGPADALQETHRAQPAIFTTSIACLEAARELGGLSSAPACVAGHSLGEYTALVAAGALTFDDGLRLVAERGRLMQEAASQKDGAMAALLGLDEDAVASVCRDTGAELCNVNAPGQIVIGGESKAVEAAMTVALERGAQRGVRLKVGGAFHTSLMQPAAEGMARVVAGVSLSDAQVPVIANTNAEPLTNEADLREELVRQLTGAVQWQRSVETMRSRDVAGVIEFGPGRVLIGLVRRIDKALAIRNVNDLESARSAAVALPSPP
jgi:[acyl-carrier-protein] S-malonyltransferase